MGSKEEQLIKNVKNLPDELINIIKGFVGSYYPFIEELKNLKLAKFDLRYLFYELEHYGNSTNKIVNDLNYLKYKPEWSPRGYSTYNKYKNKESIKDLTVLLKINKVKGRTKLIKEKNINNMINALIKI